MKKNKESASSSGQIIFFVVMPLLLALVVMRSREIQVFAQQNKQVSAVIKMFYPAWKSADDARAGSTPETDATKQNAHDKAGGAERLIKSGKGPSKSSSRHPTPHHQ